MREVTLPPTKPRLVYPSSRFNELIEHFSHCLQLFLFLSNILGEIQLLPILSQLHLHSGANVPLYSACLHFWSYLLLFCFPGFDVRFYSQTSAILLICPPFASASCPLFHYLLLSLVIGGDVITSHYHHLYEYNSQYRSHPASIICHFPLHEGAYPPPYTLMRYLLFSLFLVTVGNACATRPTSLLSTTCPPSLSCASPIPMYFPHSFAHFLLHP